MSLVSAFERILVSMHAYFLCFDVSHWTGSIGVVQLATCAQTIWWFELFTTVQF